MNPDRILPFVELLASPPDDVNFTEALGECVWGGVEEGERERACADFGAAVYAHPTALASIVAALPTLSEESSDAQWRHAIRILIGLRHISEGSALICEHLVLKREVRIALAACCRRCRTPPFEVFEFQASFLFDFTEHLLHAGHSTYMARNGLLGECIALVGRVLAVLKQRGVSGCGGDVLSHVVHRFFLRLSTTLGLGHPKVGL